MTFTDVVKTILSSSSTPMTPQEIRACVKKDYAEWFGTPSHANCVEKGHYNDLDHALLSQIYSLVRTSDAFFCDKSTRPMKVSLYEAEITEGASVEDFEVETGYVYVLRTETYTKEGKEIIKIGFTSQDVEKRINQLYTTGVPFKFKIYATYKTKNFIELESALHKLLDPFKLNKSREFFTEDALSHLEKIVDIHKAIQQETDF